MNLRIFTDGAARGNPGPAGIGVVIYDGADKVLEDFKKYLGETTNNVAEYQGLISGLECARKYRPCSIRVHMDSELVVRQMKGEYRVKNGALVELFRTVRGMLVDFESYDFVHIPREQNKLADRLANQAIDAVQFPSPGNSR